MKISFSSELVLSSPIVLRAMLAEGRRIYEISSQGRSEIVICISIRDQRRICDSVLEPRVAQ
jgi:hypothetical protein